MTKQDIIRKLTSRKLWIALAGFIAGIIVACKGDSATAETVSGCIMSGASVIGRYMAEILLSQGGWFPERDFEYGLNMVLPID